MLIEDERLTVAAYAMIARLDELGIRIRSDKHHLFKFGLEEAKQMFSAGLDAILEKRKPIRVIFTEIADATEDVLEYVQMPSGAWVVMTTGGDSLWFDVNGIHPKSRLVFEPQHLGLCV